MPWFPQREAEKGGRQEHQRRREQYSIRLWMKAFYVGKHCCFSWYFITLLKGKGIAIGFVNLAKILARLCQSVSWFVCFFVWLVVNLAKILARLFRSVSWFVCFFVCLVGCLVVWLFGCLYVCVFVHTVFFAL